MNKYGPETIKKGAFPRKRALIAFRHKPTGGVGRTVTRKALTERRAARYKRSKKHMAVAPRAVPIGGSYARGH